MLFLDWRDQAPAAALGAAAATAAAGWAVTATRLHTRTRQLHRAHRDPVTGLLTRAAWEPSAQAALRRPGSALGLIDLDGFKSVNDTHGHKVGDHVLRTVSARLKAELGLAAVAGRLGGDELAFVDRGICPDQLDGLLTALTAPIPVTSTKDVRVGASLGISALGRAVTLSDALVAADLAMYEAKTRRCGWRLHTPQSEAGDTPRWPAVEVISQ